MAQQDPRWDDTGSVVALVPARGGSKGVPGKNLRRVGGRSLLQRAIEAAIDLVDEVIVSSDAENILQEGRRCGATPLLRPPALAADDSTTLDVVNHVMRQRPHAGRLVLLQPTSPLRIPQDVARCLAAVGPAPSAVTVTRLEHPVEWTYRVESVGGVARLRPILPSTGVSRRQDLPPSYVLNGAVYCVRRTQLEQRRALVTEETVPIIMPRQRSVDIDSELDLSIAEILAARADAMDEAVQDGSH